jgi:gentisate 1,2-dioxygenase
MAAQVKPSGGKTLEQLDAELEAMHIRGQWKVGDAQFFDGPQPAGVPQVWKWSEVHPKLLESCIAMPESRTARRSLLFYNPGLNWRGTTQTLLAGMQAVRPGEIAWAHRHSMAALRFSVAGHPKLYTVVDGEPLPMETNDLVLTPSYTWHDHHNDSDIDGIWLDVLDVPFTVGLNQPFFEAYGEEAQTRRARGSDSVLQRTGSSRPAWEQPASRSFPYRYPWQEVVTALDKFRDAEGSPYDGLALEYVNPATGGPTLPTLACYVNMLRPGFEGKGRRRTSSAVYYVIEGEGATLCGDEEVRWSPQDVFCVPNWIRHRHVNRSLTDRVVLFCVSDDPILSAIGLYREDPENTLRAVPLPALPSRPQDMTRKAP